MVKRDGVYGGKLKGPNTKDYGMLVFRLLGLELMPLILTLCEHCQHHVGNDKAATCGLMGVSGKIQPLSAGSLLVEDLGFRSLSVRLTSIERLAWIGSLGYKGFDPMASHSAAGLTEVAPKMFNAALR